ncbi:Minf_1886 family protein [Rariglobus hedericola]|uniref:Uncharacterized protein n=1 Tax=Rariglobus hedericola TaxID=2597822 RepID=A0A556QR20_9BACT|nr:Minf_1886 family protein [Rariglobus hedericola]TSJ79069.1 hypothetical protein FPL22_07175 [Rariglobus hedericola]
MSDLDFNEIVNLICKEDSRYDRKAYGFLREGLDYAVKELKKKENERAKQSLHVSGAELLMGIRAYALDQFGPLAITVLNSWGINRCGDFGEIVFNLIEYNVFSKTENDRREDFSEVYTFEEAFVKPFQPKHPRTGGTVSASQAPSA